MGLVTSRKPFMFFKLPHLQPFALSLKLRPLKLSGRKLTELCCRRPSSPGCPWIQSQPVWTDPPRRAPGWDAPGPEGCPGTLGSTGPEPAHSRSPCRTPVMEKMTFNQGNRFNYNWSRLDEGLPRRSRSGQDLCFLLFSETSPHTAEHTDRHTLI